MAKLIDSYPESNQSGTLSFGIPGGLDLAHGQALAVVNAFVLDSAKFHLRKSGSPTGNAVARVYACTGTPGSDGRPTGAALAVSDDFDVSSLTTTLQLVTFAFSGANRITLNASTNYCIAVEYSGGTSGNYLLAGYDSTSATHAGNRCYLSSGGVNWWNSTNDIIFYLYGEGNDWTQPLSDSISLSDDNAGYPYHWPQALDDQITLSDGPTTLHGHGRSLADTLTLSEELSADHHDASLVLALADGLILSDLQLVSPLAEEEIPPVFPIPPGADQVLIHGYLTDVIGPAAAGDEQRVQLRAIPRHGLEFTWADLDSREAQLLASLLYRSAERWVVPCWPVVTAAARDVTAEATRVYLPAGYWATSLWALWALEAAAGALYVVLWRNAWDWEAQRYTGHGSDVDGEYVTLAAALAHSWPAGTAVLPGFAGHLVGETPRDRLGHALKSGRLTFRSVGVA